MPIVYTSAPTASQRKEIQNTYNLCCQAEPLALSCPQDADIYWLLTDGGGTVLSFLAAWQTGEALWECCAFTRPGCRRKGYASRLLDTACGEGAPLEEGDILFAADGNSPAGIRALECLGAQAAEEEYLMECALPSPMQAPSESCGPRLALGPPAEDGAPFSASLLDADGRELGSCLLSPSGSSVCLSSLHIREELRGKGLGTAFLGLLLPALAEEGFSRIILQVSGSNAPALALYKKIGFRVMETLLYYLY